MKGTLPLERPRAAGDGAGPARRTSTSRSVPRPGRILSVGGGKGGVGKSLLSASLGIELARLGSRVVLVDADLGGANLHTCLGLEPPRRTLSDFTCHHVERIEDVLVETGLPNLSLISGAFDHLDAANPTHGQKMRLVRQLRSLPADFLVLDLGAGTQKNTLDFFLLADVGIAVLVPEHGAVENAHRFLKAAWGRRLRTASTVFGLGPRLDAILERRRFPGPVEILDALEAVDGEAGRQLREQMASFRPALVVNQVRGPEDAELGPGVVDAWRRHYGVEMRFLGAVPHDDEVWRSVRARQPLLRARPEGEAARALAAIASRILALDADASSGGS